MRATSRRHRRQRLALVVDPRFSGGTCAALAREILTLNARFDLTVYGIETRMFKGRTVNPRLAEALTKTDLSLVWNPAVIRSDVVAFHNPSCLKFNDALDCRIVCDRAFLVTSENFLRPTGGEGFDVERCLSLIDGVLIARERWLAPVSTYNRDGVARWLQEAQTRGLLRPGPFGERWELASFDWFNICDFDLTPPVDCPADRRGRLSRPGFEKFPALETMRAHFPPHARSCVILGGDSFLIDPVGLPEHWRVEKFGALDVSDFFDLIDFFVYFTHPLWRESFGRVIAEAIAAGKMVITDPGTAEVFGEAVIGAAPESDIDAIIASYVAAPERYVSFVLRAQRHLAQFSGEAFAEQLSRYLQAEPVSRHDLL